MTLEKPPHGAPCNGCGLCCEAVLCVLGRRVFGRTDGPCPALEPADGKRVCGLVTSPAKYAPAAARRQGVDALSRSAALLTGSGIGCDAQVEGEPANAAFRRKMRRGRPSYGTAMAALLLWPMRLTP